MIKAMRYANYLKRETLVENGVDVSKFEDMIKEKFAKGLDNLIFTVSTEQTLQDDQKCFYEFCVSA